MHSREISVALDRNSLPTGTAEKPRSDPSHAASASSYCNEKIKCEVSVDNEDNDHEQKLASTQSTEGARNTLFNLSVPAFLAQVPPDVTLG